MHQLNPKLLIALAIATLYGHTIQAQYNDETTPHKVHLEDLEIDIERNEQRALYSPQTQNRYTYRDSEVHPTAPAHLYQQNIAIPAPPHAISTAASFEATTPHQRFNIGVHPFSYNSINDETGGEADTDVDLSPPTLQQLQQLQQQQRQQSFYINPHISQASAAAAFVLVPTFDGSGISDERNYATPHSTRPTKLAYQQQLLIAPAGVRYLTSNELPDVAPTAPTYVLVHKPALEYGVPDAPFRQQLNTQQQTSVQSNQFAYAPQRSESIRPAASHHATLPYPPSFISITTSSPIENAANSYTADIPVPQYLSRSTFKPSPSDPVPDFFANRHTKSLLESYIPSWVIAKMVQQRRNLFSRNTLATPYNHRHYKRSLTGLKETKFKKRSVKKSLPPREKVEKDKKVA